MSMMRGYYGGMTGPSSPRGVVLFAVALAAGSGACSSQPASSAMRPGESATCTATFSGALSGTFDCRPATTEIGLNRAFFQFAAVSDADAGQELGIGAIIYFAGGPIPATYNQASIGALGGAFVNTAAGGWSTGSPGGSYQLTFVSFSDPVKYPNGTLYAAEGTLDATLPPTTGNAETASVMMHVTF